ncbi:uncharacterized protein LOC130654212 [Hydractinia symbiolongicarpus]|uniref:uncharacterized protein LOC130654212 n=1 Tax=Hydractinia symbiolongicarpus TaxID=13093 RepID=UPI00254DAB43|nr:uncharacterized protein LOC130654212 [Hydractinia symbiolongicarpus]
MRVRNEKSRKLAIKEFASLGIHFKCLHLSEFTMASSFFSQTRVKTYKYACVFFDEDKCIGSVKTKDIVNREEKLLSVDDNVFVRWGSGKNVQNHKATILFLNNEWSNCTQFERDWLNNEKTFIYKRQPSLVEINYKVPQLNYQVDFSDVLREPRKAQNGKVENTAEEPPKDKVENTAEETPKTQNDEVENTFSFLKLLVSPGKPLPSFSPPTSTLSTSILPDLPFSPPSPARPLQSTPAVRTTLFPNYPEQTKQCTCDCAAMRQIIERLEKRLAALEGNAIALSANFIDDSDEALPSVQGLSPLKAMQRTNIDDDDFQINERLNRKKYKVDTAPTIEIPTEFWPIANEVRQGATSFKNFSYLLLAKLFDHKELVGRNCRGVKKPAIDGYKQDIVKAFCWKFYPTNMAAPGAWRDCQRAIDEFIRRSNRTKKNYKSCMLQS